MSILKVKDINGNVIDIPAIRGYSAYQSAVANGFKGTEEEWLASLKGDPYELTDYDINIIRGEVVETLRPTVEETDRRIDILEEEHTDIYNQVALLQNAIANFSKFEVIKVDSLEEMTSANVIYLLPVSDGSHYDEYILFNGAPEKIGDTDIDLTNYVTKDFLRDNVKLYRHNIALKYRHHNSTLATSGSDGTYLATFTIENNDPESYTFTHNYGGTSAAIMSLENAWACLRLYYAMQLSDRKDDKFSRPCSGALILVDTNLATQRNIIDSIYTEYEDSLATDWSRYFVVQASDCDEGDVGKRMLRVSCGHPIFTDGEHETKWTNINDFEAGEYNAIDSSGSKRYSSYFTQERLYCTDIVEEIKLCLD